MSMGRHDYVPSEISNLKFEIRVSKLKIKPGKPFVFATRGTGVSPVSSSQYTSETPVPQQKYIFGLPGNPVSGFVCTLRLASRLLARLAGGKPTEHWVSGRLDQGLGPNGPREFYQPVLWSAPAGGSSNRPAFATPPPLTWEGSADT